MLYTIDVYPSDASMLMVAVERFEADTMEQVKAHMLKWGQEDKYAKVVVRDEMAKVVMEWMANEAEAKNTAEMRQMRVQTINTQKPGKYHVQKTVGGWVVIFVNEDRSTRNVDGGKLHKNRQNAYAKAKRLNDQK